jgi:fucose permease
LQHDQHEIEAKEGSVMLASTPETPDVTANERAGGALFPSGNFLPFFLVTALFFLWGIPNNLNDVLIRHFMKSFAITRFQAGLIQSAFYMGYFLLAMPAALLMRKLGYKAGFITGLVLFWNRRVLVLAGCCGWALFLFSFCPVRHRQWTFLSGNGLQSIHRTVW